MTAGAQRVAAGFAATGGVARGADLFEQRVLGLAGAVAAVSAQLAQPRLQIPLEQVEEAALIVAGRVEHQVVEAPADVVPTFSTASSGSEATIQRLATCSMGSSSAAFSISSGSWMLVFCSAVSDSGAQNRVFSSASSGSVS